MEAFKVLHLKVSAGGVSFQLLAPDVVAHMRAEDKLSGVPLEEPGEFFQALGRADFDKDGAGAQAYYFDEMIDAFLREGLSLEGAELLDAKTGLVSLEFKVANTADAVLELTRAQVIDPA